jgi:hypothetical protein
MDTSELPEAAHPSALQTSLAFGAMECAEVDHLLPRQRKVACRIIRSIHQIGGQEARYEASFARPPHPTGQRYELSPARDYAWSVEAREPIFAYLIDGPRGSGKTTLLRTARYLLELTWALPFDRQSGFGGEFEKLGLGDLNGIKVLGKQRALVHALPLLRPDHMEPGEAIMEAIFSQMAPQLKAVQAAVGESDGRGRTARELVRS